MYRSTQDMIVNLFYFNSETVLSFHKNISLLRIKKKKKKKKKCVNKSIFLDQL